MAAERGWSMMYAAILVNNFKFCEFNRRRTVPISLLRGYHGTTSADTVANFIASIVEVDGVAAARLVDSLATLESSLCKLSVGLYFKSDSNRTY
jgi:hypothetical protein